MSCPITYSVSSRVLFQSASLCFVAVLWTPLAFDLCIVTVPISPFKLYKYSSPSCFLQHSSTSIRQSTSFFQHVSSKLQPDQYFRSLPQASTRDSRDDLVRGRLRQSSDSDSRHHDSQRCPSAKQKRNRLLELSYTGPGNATRQL
jgi:hypothetical protein